MSHRKDCMELLKGERIAQVEFAGLRENILGNNRVFLAKSLQEILV